MSTVMVQLRNVPSALHGKMKARAVQNGQSLSDYIQTEMQRVVGRPTWEEFRTQRAQREVLEAPIDWAAAVREARDSR